VAEAVGTPPQPQQPPPQPEETFPAYAGASGYSPRFRLLLGALVGVAIGALAATLMVTVGGEVRRSGPPWSAWHPSDRGTDGAKQIARHIGPNYRLPSGGQLVLVTGGPLKVADLDLPVHIAVSSGGTADRVALVEGKSVLYVLCGLGPRCAINKGKPSVARFLLLRREALELALYSFRYLKGVDNVVALLPPAPGSKPENALFFQRGGLEPALDRPLGQTLPAPPPTINSLADSPEASLINRLTNTNLFRFTFQQGQDLSAFLVLARRAG
jgi:hypothetical protein